MRIVELGVGAVYEYWLKVPKKDSLRVLKLPLEAD
jgi:hypothetical protein